MHEDFSFLAKYTGKSDISQIRCSDIGNGRRLPNETKNSYAFGSRHSDQPSNLLHLTFSE